MMPPLVPRAPESKPRFIARLRAQAATLAQRPVGLGSAHHSHAVVEEDGVFRVRRLVLPGEKVEGYRQTHRTFMPEHAEMLSEPTGEIVLEAPTLEGLLSRLEAVRWPL